MVFYIEPGDYKLYRIVWNDNEKNILKSEEEENMKIASQCNNDIEKYKLMKEQVINDVNQSLSETDLIKLQPQGEALYLMAEEALDKRKEVTYDFVLMYSTLNLYKKMNKMYKQLYSKHQYTNQ